MMEEAFDVPMNLNAVVCLSLSDLRFGGLKVVRVLFKYFQSKESIKQELLAIEKVTYWDGLGNSAFPRDASFS